MNEMEHFKTIYKSLKLSICNKASTTLPLGFKGRVEEVTQEKGDVVVVALVV